MTILQIIRVDVERLLLMEAKMDYKCDKMIIAIIQGDDYQEVIAELNQHGFYATILHSKGGFLRKQSVTVMIGLNHENLDEALRLLKAHGERTEIQYKPLFSEGGHIPLTATVPTPVHCGGVVLFVLDIEQYGRY